MNRITNRFKQYHQISSLAEETLMKRIKFIFRSAFHYKHTNRFFDFFEQHPYQNIASNHPEIYRRIFRRYISLNLTSSQKAHHLISHFQFMTKTFCDEWIETIYCKNSAVRLLEMPVGDKTFSVDMFYNVPLGGEGGIVLLLTDELNTTIYTTSLSFVEIKGKLHVRIGGLQGPRPSEVNAAEIVKFFTKNMHGLRPMNFMIVVVRVLSQIIGANILEGVSTKYHAGHSLNSRRKLNFKSDYDKYWLEEGGVLHGAFYTLPLEEERKSYDEIKSNKRSMYSKRYAMLDQLTENINERLHYGLKYCN